MLSLSLAYGFAILAGPSFNLVLIKGRPGNQNLPFRLNLAAKPAGSGAGSAGFNILNFRIRQGFRGFRPGSAGFNIFGPIQGYIIAMLQLANWCKISHFA